MNRESDTNMTESDTMIMEMDTKTIKVRDLQNQVDELTKKRVQDTTVGHLLNVFGIFPRDTRNEPTISETKKQDVWTYDGPEDQFKRNGNWAFRGEILAALNGAPAADGMIINPDRYWYEHYQKAQEEIGEFKRQLADRKTVTVQDWEPKTIGPIHPNDVFPDSDKRPKRGGWSPGHYQNSCKSCNVTFTGDKRASTCAPCAYKDTKSASSDVAVNPVTESATVVPGPIEAYRPWTMDDVQAGTVLRCHVNSGRSTELVTYAGPNGVDFGVVAVSYDGLLRSNRRQLNGDRCGVRINTISNKL